MITPTKPRRSVRASTFPGSLTIPDALQRHLQERLRAFNRGCPPGAHVRVDFGFGPLHYGHTTTVATLAEHGLAILVHINGVPQPVNIDYVHVLTAEEIEALARTTTAPLTRRDALVSRHGLDQLEEADREGRLAVYMAEDMIRLAEAAGDGSCSEQALEREGWSRADIAALGAIATAHAQSAPRAQALRDLSSASRAA